MTTPATADAPLVRVTGLTKRFGGITALRGIELEVARGEVVVFVGPSGCGKSTLLRCLNGLEQPTEGALEVCGLSPAGGAADLNALRRRVGMVFQRFHLFPHLTAAQNVSVGPRHVLGLRAHEAGARASALLERVGLGDRGGAYPSQLSGGQLQRVAIARALAMQPELMLFDEPTSALDPEMVGEVLDVMRALVDDGMTMCIVTHEIGFARNVAHRAVFLDEGAIVEQGPPDTVLRSPDHPRTREFLHRLLHDEPSR